MMTECDPTETGDSTLDAGATAVPTSEGNPYPPEHPTVIYDRTRLTLGLAANPGVAVRLWDSCESVLTELEAEGSGEEALLLPCLAGSSSPRGVREKRSRRNRRSSSSDKDTLASPGKFEMCSRCGGGRTLQLS